MSSHILCVWSDPLWKFIPWTFQGVSSPEALSVPLNVPVPRQSVIKSTCAMYSEVPQTPKAQLPPEIPGERVGTWVSGVGGGGTHCEPGTVRGTRPLLRAVLSVTRDRGAHIPLSRCRECSSGVTGLPGDSGWRETGRTRIGTGDLTPKPFLSCVHSLLTPGLHYVSKSTQYPAGRYPVGDGKLEFWRQSAHPSGSTPGPAPGSSWKRYMDRSREWIRQLSRTNDGKTRD